MADAGLRRGTLARKAPFVLPAKLMLEPCAVATRFSFRGGTDVAFVRSAAFGVTLPHEPCRAAESGERAALWLGPDEWLLLGSDGKAAEISARTAVRLGGTPYSLVDISHRQTGLSVSGP